MRWLHAPDAAVFASALDVCRVLGC
jgi:hypothetical protein